MSYGSLTVEGNPSLDEAVKKRIDEVHHDRVGLAELKNTLAAHQADLAAELVETHGLSLRDAGTIIGVSHQRVGQMLAELRQPAAV